MNEPEPHPASPMKFSTTILFSLVLFALGGGLLFFHPVLAASVPMRAFELGALATSTHMLLVAPNGSDLLGTGSAQKPFATPGGASRRAAPGDVIVIRAGTYPTFGALRASGTEARPIIVRPESMTFPVFALQGPWDGIEIAASHLRIEGLEIHESGITPPARGYCVRMTRPVEDITLSHLVIHDCETGVRASQKGASSKHLVLEDVEIRDVNTYGVHCLIGSCTDVDLQRVRISGVGRAALSATTTALFFGPESQNITIEDSEISGVAGDGVVMQGSEALISNSFIHAIDGHPMMLENGGTVFACDIRDSGLGIVLTAGATYHLRGNLIEGLYRAQRGAALEVTATSSEQEGTGALLLEGNRIVSRDGDLLLPVFTTIKGNTFFFLQPEDGLAMQATGTNLINQGGNISVARGPEAEDLTSPVYLGGYAQAEPLTGGMLIFPGTRFKGSGPAVYVYGPDGRRHAFPDERVYRTWFRDFSGLIVIEDAALERIPLGRNVTSRPGVRLLKLPSSDQVYAVAQGRTLRWVKTEALAQALYGSAWATKVDDLSEALFVNYAMGAPIERAEEYHPDQERAQSVSPVEGM